MLTFLWPPVSALTISNVQPGFTGNWECRVRTSRGNTTRTVHIVVLETSAKYCAPERVSNNRGEFRWVRALCWAYFKLSCSPLWVNIDTTASISKWSVLGSHVPEFTIFFQHTNVQEKWDEANYQALSSASKVIATCARLPPGGLGHLLASGPPSPATGFRPAAACTRAARVRSSGHGVTATAKACGRRTTIPAASSRKT